MRTFFLVSIAAILIACGMAYAVGLVTVTTDHPEGKCIVSLIINTEMVHHSTSSADSASQNAPGDSTLDAKGKITAVRADKNEVVVSENFKNWTFQLAKDAKVYLNNRESKLGELQVGDDVTVTFDRQGEQYLAREIRSTRK
jgi:Cu/Ag efflux protein CusF